MKHTAKQTVSPVLDPPLKLSLTLKLSGDTARRWRQYMASLEAQHLEPSDAQVATALLAKALESWDDQAKVRGR